MSSCQAPRDPWAAPRSSESKTLCVPDDVPFPANIQSILEESRKASSNPEIMSWKEVVCAGPDDMQSVEITKKDASSEKTASDGDSKDYGINGMDAA
ncbi:MAG: hypothetical protein L6R38_002395 [Xanthoria sp. 2 TBL-2021]|nr:MAG: hypothetical protein L6R38_002395 [Xanthoria sp. 2 TBL-2021]